MLQHGSSIFILGWQEEKKNIIRIEKFYQGDFFREALVQGCHSGHSDSMTLSNSPSCHLWLAHRAAAPSLFGSKHQHCRIQQYDGIWMSGITPTPGFCKLPEIYKICSSARVYPLLRWMSWLLCCPVFSVIMAILSLVWRCLNLFDMFSIYEVLKWPKHMVLQG